MQVGVLRRGKYFKGKKVGKGNAVNEVSLSCNRFLYRSCIVM